MKNKKKEPMKKSFGYAFEGIFTCISKERNMKIHCVMAILVVAAGTLLHISVTEWCICLILFGLVMALEMVNTAVEAVVDLVTEERKPLAKIAKDTAAGAVLIAAIMAAIAGCMIFVPKGILFISNLG
ncbi:MAG: diacylglycerol kinase family protein [Hespellia sp.]|nr:diacylglycerol kinase family protein [Hespellia sp.]